MAETPEDKLSRLKQMTIDGCTWDLSPNDQAAIAWAIDQVEKQAVKQPERMAVLYRRVDGDTGRLLKEYVVTRSTFEPKGKPVNLLKMYESRSVICCILHIEEITNCGAYEVTILE